MTAPDVRGRLRGIQRARRQGRRRRPAPHAHGRGAPTSTSSIRPGTDALLLLAMVHVLFDEDLVDLGTPGEHRRRARRGRARWPSRSRPRRSPTGVRRSTPSTIRRHRPRARRRADGGAVYGRIGTTTQAFGTTRELARRRAQRAAPATSTGPGGAMFTEPAAGDVEHARRAAARARASRSAAGRSPRARAPRDASASCRSSAWPRRSRRPGEGQIRALVTLAGNPVRVDAERRPRSTRALASLDFMVCDRHLRQRDDAPRRRDPARALAAGAVPLRRRALQLRGAQRRELLAPLSSSPTRRCRTSGRSLLRLAAIVAGAGRRRRRRRARRLRRRRLVGAPCATSVGRHGRDPTS